MGDMGKEQAGEGCVTEQEEMQQGDGERRKSNLKSGAMQSPTHH